MPVSEVMGFEHEVLPGNPRTGAGGPAAPVRAGMELTHSGLRCNSDQRTVCAVDIKALVLALAGLGGRPTGRTVRPRLVHADGCGAAWLAGARPW
jgi:hypothetical protein